MIQYILRRLVIAVPTLVLISMLVFVLIDAMPGSYVDVIVAQNLADTGIPDLTDGQRKLLEFRYGIGRPIYIRWWKWFSNFVVGEMGHSVSYGHKKIVDLITERLALTVTISFCTTVFVLLVSLPIGVYSAVNQYSTTDHIFTFIGFLGLSIPNFMLALAFIVISFYWFGQVPGGLFSPQYLDAPWSIPKVLDMLSRMWIPVVVLGTAGTAGYIRVLRGNMLDELGRQYVVTARAKGLNEVQVLWKYPFRIAINPLITAAGGLLSALLGGELIVSIVLNLPTMGPLLYVAVENHDAFLAGAMVMLLSVLLVVGYLLADILLSWVDPRVRYE